MIGFGDRPSSQLRNRLYLSCTVAEFGRRQYLLLLAFLHRLCWAADVLNLLFLKTDFDYCRLILMTIFEGMYYYLMTVFRHLFTMFQILILDNTSKYRKSNVLLFLW